MAATLSAGEALARRKVSFLLRKGDTDLHASVEQKRCNRRVCDRAIRLKVVYHRLGFHT